MWGTEGHERLEFMWDTDGRRVFADALVRQAEAFVRALGGAPLEGTGADDAVIALAAARRAAKALAASTERERLSAL